jgi:hypothetical protein
MWIWRDANWQSAAPAHVSGTQLVFEYVYVNRGAPVTAMLHILADDFAADVYVNNVKVSRGIVTLGQFARFSVDLINGYNQISLAAWNGGGIANPAGLLVAAMSGTQMLFHSDGSWRWREAAGWTLICLLCCRHADMLVASTCMACCLYMCADWLGHSIT